MGLGSLDTDLGSKGEFCEAATGIEVFPSLP